MLELPIFAWISKPDWPQVIYYFILVEASLLVSEVFSER